jgi:hypothetical protein
MNTTTLSPDWPSCAKPMAEWKQILLITSIASAIIVIRNPLFFLLPRVFAEEPGHYLANALVEPFPSSFGVTMAGYFSIVPNFAAELAAKVFPLEYAAHVFTSVGFIIQLLTIISIYYSAGRVLPSKPFAALSAIGLLVIAKPETWLNTVYSMYWLATGMFYILNSRSINRFHIVYASLAFLTGPTSLIWLPFFGMRWLIGVDKANSRERKVGLILGIGIVALAMNVSLSLFGESTASIGSRLKPEMLLNLPRGFTSMFAHLIASGGYPIPIVLAALIVVAVLTGNAFYNGDLRFRLFTIGAMIYYANVVAVLSFEMQGGNRYALPITAGLFSLSVVGASNLFFRKGWAKRKWRWLGFAVVLLIVIGNKLIEFRDFSGVYAKSNYVYDRSWPNWKDQIEAIDRSKGGEIKTFPQWADTGLQGEDWSFDLPPGVGR